MVCPFRKKCEKFDEESPTCKSSVDSVGYCGIAKGWIRK